MDIMGFIMGTAGVAFALIALARIDNLEKKLRQFDVVPSNLDSNKDLKDAEAE